MSKEEIEKANAMLAKQWREKLTYMGVDLVDVLEYETRRILGAIWKQALEQNGNQNG